MCGIVGALSDGPVDPMVVVAMRDKLVHRGPDHAGLWLSDDSRVCLGHRRLAIVDLSPEANQPFVSSDNRFVVTFNGEIYNFQSLRDELQTLGAKFRTRSDTEVLVEAYRTWGAQCLERFSGMFAFAIWDGVERQLFCARDRVGEKPFYYALVGDSFIFGSEIKALVVWPGFRKQVHYPALIDYLFFGFVPDPKCIWEGCQKLSPGHSLVVELRAGSSLRVHKPRMYWDVKYEPEESADNWEPRILETLQRASREMAFADVPVGAFLSGGVDSSSVTAALSKAGCNINTFTIGFEERGFDERPYAREVAQLYGTTHTERVVQPADVTAAFKKLLFHYDEPFNDYSYLPTYYLCREARQLITVALSGDGGDEVFAGYRKFQRLGMRQDVERLVPRPFRRLLAAGAGAVLSESSPMRRTLHQYGADAAEMFCDMFRLGFSLRTLRTMSRGPLKESLSHYSPMDTVLTLIRKVPPAEAGLVNTMRYLDLKLTLAGDMLVKVDRASMAVSLEVRPVYLHRTVVELAAKIPPRLLADRNHSKEVLKSALRAWLPDSILYRKKQGLAMPLKMWFKRELRPMFADSRSENPLQELLDPALLEKLTSQHLCKKADLTSLIHALVFLRHWLEEWTGTRENE